jgi:phosphoribosylanthranilate isomerase
MNETTLDAVNGLPIDQIGFVFAMSRRQVSPQRAGELIRHLRRNDSRGTGPAPLTVGVFVSPSMEELEAVMTHAELDVIQLHGGENADFCRQIKARFPKVGIYKVISIGAGSAAFVGDKGSLIPLEPFADVVDAVMLDTHDPTVGGGTGRAFDWEIIPVYREWAKQAGVKLIVAGGLDVDNVADLIRTYRPDGVDVSSSVETDGVKDAAKIRAFVERVKAV